MTPLTSSSRAYLETALDRAAAAKPNPGELPILHRLTRTEYQNAIRDLLALDNLPKEMDFTLLLPADNSSSGFDNIADLLFVSPATMERYLDAASKISRLAVGDPQIPVMVNIHQLPLEEPQDSRVEELPFGTRGGMAVQQLFPAGCRLRFQVELAGDGARAASARDQRGWRAQAAWSRSAARAAEAARRRRGSRGAPTQFRIPVKAGPQADRRRRSCSTPKRWMKPPCVRAAQPRNAAGDRRRHDPRSL